MKRCFSLLACAVFAIGAAVAQAGPVTFTYDFTPSDSTISGDKGHNWIDISNQAPNTVTVSKTDIVASNLTVHNNLSDTFVGSGSGVPYTIKLTLTDGAAPPVTLAFAGHITPDSFIDNGNPNLNNVIDTAAVVPLTLNGHTYTIQMTSFVSPSPFNADPTKVTKGAIGFHITADDGSGTQPPSDSPEPSTMLLSCLGLGGLGWRALRRRTARA